MISFEPLHLYLARSFSLDLDIRPPFSSGLGDVYVIGGSEVKTVNILNQLQFETF